MTLSLDEFQNARIGIFSHSPKARLLWKENSLVVLLGSPETGRWCCTLAFGDVEPFLKGNDFCRSYRGKALAILKDSQKRSLLQVELAVVIDVGKQFVRATYELEGDGSLVFLVLRFFHL